MGGGLVGTGVEVGADLVDDAQASNGKAVRMPGSHSNWAVQFHIPSGSMSPAIWFGLSACSNTPTTL